MGANQTKSAQQCPLIGGKVLFEKASRQRAEICTRGGYVVTSAPCRHYAFPVERHLYPDGIRAPCAPRLVQAAALPEDQEPPHPQRLRFRLPEIVQGEHLQSAQDRAVQTWIRTQIAPMLDRSIGAIIGDKQLRKAKRPIGLRGKYYPLESDDPSSHWKTPGVPGSPSRWKDRWDPLDAPRSYITKRFNLRVEIHRRGKRQEGKIVFDIPATTDHHTVPRLLAFPHGIILEYDHIKRQLKAPVSPHPWLGPIDSPNTKDAGFAPWTQYDYRERDDLKVSSADERPVLKGRWIFHQAPQRPDQWQERRFWLRPRIWTPVPWLMRDPPWCSPFAVRCEAYAVAVERQGFVLKDGKPVSTYVAERRIHPPVGSIEDDDAWRADVHLESGEEREDVWKIGLHTQVQRDDGTVVYGEVLAPEVIEMEVEGVEAVFDPVLARDMSTRYAWQVARDIPYSRDYSGMMDGAREKEWQAFFDSPHAFLLIKPPKQVFKRGRPRKGDRKFSPVAEIILWLRGDQLRRHGTLYRDLLDTVAREFRISVAMAKRAYDRIRRRKK